MSEQAVSILERMVAPAFKERLLVNACCLRCRTARPLVDWRARVEPLVMTLRGRCGTCGGWTCRNDEAAPTLA